MLLSPIVTLISCPKLLQVGTIDKGIINLSNKRIHYLLGQFSVKFDFLV